MAKKTLNIGNVGDILNGDFRTIHTAVQRLKEGVEEALSKGDQAIGQTSTVQINTLVNNARSIIATSGLYGGGNLSHDVTVGINYRAAHWYSPSGNFASIGISGIEGQSEDMATWQPSGLYKTHVDGSGAIGVNDPTPTANLSIRTRESFGSPPSTHILFDDDQSILKIDNPTPASGWLFPSATSVTVEFLISVPSGNTDYDIPILNQQNGNYCFNTRLYSGLISTKQSIVPFYGGYVTFVQPTSVDIRDGLWHHYAFTIQHSPRVIRHWLDGVFMGASSNGNAWDMRTTAPLGAGGEMGGDVKVNYDGITHGISGMRMAGLLMRTGLVYTDNTPFTPPFGELIPSGTIGDYSNIILYCPMTEGTGQWAYDLGPNGFDLQFGLSSILVETLDAVWDTTSLENGYADGAYPLQDWKDAEGAIDSIVNEEFNWGLGTDDPQEKLHVVGNIYATSVIYAPVVSGSTAVYGTLVQGANVIGSTSVSGTVVRGVTVSGVNIVGATSVTAPSVVGTTSVSGATVYGTTVSGVNIKGSVSVSGLAVQAGTLTVRGTDSDERYAFSGALYGNGTSGTLPVYDEDAHLTDSIIRQTLGDYTNPLLAVNDNAARINGSLVLDSTPYGRIITVDASDNLSYNIGTSLTIQPGNAISGTGGSLAVLGGVSLSRPFVYPPGLYIDGVPPSGSPYVAQAYFVGSSTDDDYGIGGDVFLAGGTAYGISGTPGHVKILDNGTGLTAGFDVSLLTDSRMFAFPDESGTFALSGQSFTKSESDIRYAFSGTGGGGGSTVFPFASGGFHQFSGTLTYQFDHGMGAYPVVQVLDSGLVQIEAQVTHLSNSGLRLDFEGSITDGWIIYSAGSVGIQEGSGLYTADQYTHVGEGYGVTVTDSGVMVNTTELDVRYAYSGMGGGGGGGLTQAQVCNITTLRLV